jgi:hypothetical protein
MWHVLCYRNNEHHRRTKQRLRHIVSVMVEVVTVQHPSRPALATCPNKPIKEVDSGEEERFVHHGHMGKY